MPQKVLYEVNLPDDFDFRGQVRNLSGTVLAFSRRQAVRFFILKHVDCANRHIYDDFKSHVRGNTELFAKKTTRVIAEHYATKYTGKLSEYGGRLNSILRSVGFEGEGLPDFDAVCDMLEKHYDTKWGSNIPGLRSVYRTVREASTLIGDCDSIDN